MKNFILTISILFFSSTAHSAEEKVVDSPLITTQEFLKDCEAALSYADKGMQKEYFRTNCYNHVSGMAFGEGYAILKRVSAFEVEKQHFCFKRALNYKSENTLFEDSMIFIKDLVLMLKSDINEHPEYKNVPFGHHMFITNSAVNLCPNQKSK